MHTDHHHLSNKTNPKFCSVYCLLAKQYIQTSN
uniref:Uncharacterized protein n=1 Tax=Rhizophora mucronata TaxID=61149 RepID=A0A2P2JTH2_RHIMU